MTDCDLADDELEAASGMRVPSVPAQIADPATTVLHGQIFLEISILAASRAAPPPATTTATKS
jgi:hypothetical protein